MTLLVPDGDPAKDPLERNRDLLAELFIVSDLKVGPTAEPGDPFGVGVRPCAELGHVRCPRCWRWVPALVRTPIAEVCPRCSEALAS